MNKIERAQKKQKHKALRGQAMVEYSFITWALALALVIGGSMRLPGTNGNVFDLFIAAYQMYYDSFYFVLNMPFP